MYEAWLAADTCVSVALIAVWALASWRLGCLTRCTEQRRPMSDGTWTAAVLVLAGVPTLAKAALVALTLFYGWEFRANSLVFAVPMVLVPAVLAYASALPAVLRLRRVVRAADEAALPAAQAALTDTKVALPARLATIGSVITLWLGFFQQPVPGLGDDLLLYGTAFLLAAAWQVWGLRRAAARHVTGIGPGPGVRAAGTAARWITFAGCIVLGIVSAATSSTLPGSYSMSEHQDPADAAGADRQAAGHTHGAHGAVAGRSITELTGPRSGKPARTFTLTARKAQVTLPSGAEVDGWTYNGTVPGPLLRVKQHELVEIELVNQDVEAGVSLHWHGVDVPNAEDGVPGLTQDAVPVGGRHVYRFRAPDVGSFWYPSHQLSSEQVRAGLYGGFVVDPPAGPDPSVTDIPVVLHTFKGQLQTINGVDLLERRTVAPGRKVRLRLINTDSLTRTFSLTGTTFRLTGIDGMPVNGPGEVTGKLLELGGGGRYDIEFTMPADPVRLAGSRHRDKGLLLTPDGSGEREPDFSGDELDTNTYGQPAPTGFGLGTKPTQTVKWVIDNHLGFFDGKIQMVFTVNGKLFPDIPPVVVRENDLVRVRFVNRSFIDHPMHLHGHHVLVLSRNGDPASGSPQWLDTVLVEPGETYEVMFRADNPGIWMDHCHNLDHAATGMVMHLAYEGWTTPYLTGADTPNQPE